MIAYTYMLRANLRCTGQQELWSFALVFPSIDARRIFEGRIGEGKFWQVFQRCSHSSRSIEDAETMSQAAGELGPLGGLKFWHTIFRREKKLI